VRTWLKALAVCGRESERPAADRIEIRSVRQEARSHSAPPKFYPSYPLPPNDDLCRRHAIGDPFALKISAFDVPCELAADVYSDGLARR
jgi:hypothetical protein